MKVTINSTDINVLSCTEEFSAGNSNGTLNIVIEQTEIDYPTLNAVISTNTGPIVKTDGDMQTTYYGYTQSSSVATVSDGTYHVRLGSVPESEKKIAELTAKFEKATETIAVQAEELAMTQVVLDYLLML